MDTANGKRDTSTFSSWSVQFKPTFEVTVPVRPIRGANDKFLFCSIIFFFFGLVLMILSQIILKGKDLKDEQKLTI